MNDGRKNCSSSVREDGEIVTITQSKLKVNRLKRSPRTNQKSHNTDISVGKGELLPCVSNSSLIIVLLPLFIKAESLKTTNRVLIKY